MKDHPQVVVRLMGGLGNQMFQYAAGRTLAARLGVTLVLDIADCQADPRRRYELDRLQTVCRIADFDIRGCFSKRAGLLSRVAKRILSRLDPRVYREPGFSYDPGVRMLAAPVYLDGYWQSEKYFSDIADTLRREFTPAEPLSEANAALARRIGAENAVSLHVRRGDYVSDPTTAAFHGLCSLDYYRRAVDHVSRAVADPHFYLFSDDPDWVRKNLSLGHPCTVVDGNPDNGVADMALMRTCSHHIIANSSFSWWGAWLGQNPGKIVVAPGHWFKEPRDTRDLIPEQWVTL